MVVDLQLSEDLSDDEVDRLFRALADATRRDIVRRTLVGEASVSALAADYDMSFAAVQKHVAVLEEAGLVTKQPRGRERIVRGNPDQIARARALLVQFEELWRSRVSRLDALLAESSPPPSERSVPGAFRSPGTNTKTNPKTKTNTKTKTNPNSKE